MVQNKKTTIGKKALSVKKEEKPQKISEKTEKKPVEKRESYFESVGRRKTSVARIRLLVKGDKEILVNDKSYQAYFPGSDLQETILAPLKMMNCLDKFRVQVRAKGGGIHSQAEAVRHGLARALIIFNPEFRKRLKKAGFLTRDSRMRERKKFGLKRARRAPQWRKR